jgi:hypothetical protein
VAVPGNLSQPVRRGQTGGQTIALWTDASAKSVSPYGSRSLGKLGDQSPTLSRWGGEEARVTSARRVQTWLNCE